MVLKVERVLFIHNPHLQSLPVRESNQRTRRPSGYKPNSLTIRPQVPPTIVFSMIVLCELPKDHICVHTMAEESVRAKWLNTDDTDTMWSMADVQLFSRWDVVLVNVPCIPGLSPTNTGYCLLWEHTLSLAVYVFPLAHIHPTPVCDHNGSLPLPVPERSKVILNPPCHFQSKHNWGFSLTMHVCVHVEWLQKVENVPKNVWMPLL